LPLVRVVLFRGEKVMTRLSCLVRAAAISWLLVGVAFAQTDSPLPETALRAEPTVTPETVELEEVVVTGSHIRREDLVTPAPVRVIDREEIQASGKRSIGEFLQTLPEQGNGTNAQVNMGGDGTVNVNLRSLGANRTLVLVNGRRFVSSNSSGSSSFAVDVGAIPSFLVERVEVLKDGASAVYGSDAIAGVVNIITRTRFDGAEASVYTGRSTHGDGTAWDVNFTAGTSNDRWGLLLSGGFFEQEAVLNGQRPWGRVLNGYDYQARVPFPILSGYVPAGTFTLDPATCSTDSPACQGLLDQQVAAGEAGLASFWLVDPSSNGGARLFGPDDGYNFQPVNYLSTPIRRLSVFAAGDHELGDLARASFEASFVNRRSKTNAAPETLDLTKSHVSISADSTYNPYGVDITSYERRMVELGNRVFDSEVDTLRVVGGFDGTVLESAGPLAGWAWDVSFNYGRSWGTTTIDGMLRTDRLAEAIGPSMEDPETEQDICVRTPGDPASKIEGCTPLNLFGGAGSMPAAVGEYLRFRGVDRHHWSLGSVQANANGELFKLFSGRPIGLAVGYEFRREAGAFEPNAVSAAGLSSGNNYAATSGSFSVHEGYGEISVPILSGRPLVEELEATAAVRAFGYSTFGSDATYKLGVRWSPIRDVALRGTYSTAFRAPSIVELYAGAADTFSFAEDPCAVPDAPPSCGAAANNGDESMQVRERIGGNPNLEPETARIWTAGIVIQPRWVKGLSLAVDYYRIRLRDYVTVLGAQVILDGCYDRGIQEYCQLVHRSADDFERIDWIDDANVNVGGVTTGGVDFAVRYDMRTTKAGRFNFLFDATWLQRFDQEFSDGTVIEAKGNYDLGLVLPAWKFSAGVIWSLHGFGAAVNTRYVGSYKECDGLCSLEDFNFGERRVSAYNAWDASVGYTLRTGLGTSNLVVGLQNLFDTEPPKVYSNGYQPSDPTAYDFLGRYWSVKLTHEI
jgi:outer membrane receptor protein involved in Fe transport